MAAQYQKLFQEMLKQNEALLSDFKILHDKYQADPNTFQNQFNQEGEKVLELVQKYEKMLTSHTEKSGYGKYSANLSDKFRSAIKLIFPKLDFIGVEKKVCSAGMDRHFKGEKILLEEGSKQSNIWGGGVDLETKVIDFNSFINIRPNDNNTSNEIQEAGVRKAYEKLTRFFFKEVL